MGFIWDEARVGEIITYRYGKEDYARKATAQRHMAAAQARLRQWGGSKIDPDMLFVDEVKGYSGNGTGRYAVYYYHQVTRSDIADPQYRWR